MSLETALQLNDDELALIEKKRQVKRKLISAMTQLQSLAMMANELRQELAAHVPQSAVDGAFAELVAEAKVKYAAMDGESKQTLMRVIQQITS